MIPNSEQASTEELRKRLDYRYREIVEESSIDPDVASERDYHLEKTKTGLQRLGFTRKQQQAPAIVIPRFGPSGEEIPPQIKPDSPRLVETRGKVRTVKYEYPPNTPVRLSVHPRAVKMMRDRRYPLWICEGDKKGDSLVSRGAVAVVLQGVGCWRVPQDWEDIKLHGREVIIAFDADVMVNPNVQRELKALAAFLKERGALIKFLRWPEAYGGTKTGIDDFLAGGDGTVEDLYRLADEAPDEEAIPVGTPMADIAPETVEWLWNRRIPKGKVSILDGDPGKGKSTILYDLAARVSAGLNLPDGQSVEKAGVIIVSREDGAADTIVPRFIAAGGDVNNARIIGSGEDFVIPDDLDKLKRAIKQTRAALVIIDPVMSFLADDVNSNSDQQVRRALQPLVDVAEETGAAIKLCRHMNKSSGGGPVIYRGQGSIGIIGIVRSGLMVGDHPDRDQVFILAGQKSNLSKPPESLAYRIRSAGADKDTAVIEYLGVSEVTAQQMSTTPQDEGERDRLSEARDFLKDTLRAGPAPTKKIKADAGEADISWRTIERAKTSLKIQTFKDSETLRWMWTLNGLPEDGDDDRKNRDEGRHSSPRRPNVGGVGGVGGLQCSSSRPPTLAELAAFNSTTTTTTKNKGYIREDRQDRQDRQGPNGGRRGDEISTPPTNSANELRQLRQVTEDRQAVDEMVTQTPVSFSAKPGEDVTVAELQARQEQEQNADDWGEI
jgi:hypothetical protein